MTIKELLAATGLTANDLVPIYDAEAAQSVEPTQKITAAQFAAAVKVLASLVNTTEMNAAIQQSTAWRRLYANGTYTNHVGVTLQLSESLQNVKLLFITAYTSSISSTNRIVFIIPVNSSIGASYFCAAYGTNVQTIRVEGANTSFTVLSTSLSNGLFINEILALG